MRILPTSSPFAVSVPHSRPGCKGACRAYRERMHALLIKSSALNLEPLNTAGLG